MGFAPLQQQMMMVALFALWAMCLPDVTFGFTGIESSKGRIRQLHRSVQRLPVSAASVPNHNNQEIFVVNWEGCLADCVPWRIRVGIDAAFSVWPEALAATADFARDTTWLHNKLAAISHCLSVSTAGDDTGGYSATCDYALAARLLLEEQALDGGQSSGKSGKYASRYHPQDQQQPTDEQYDRKARRPRLEGRTSRPLTVGELSANWSEGGMIRDAIQMRYHSNYQDPVPRLQEAIDSLLSASSEYDSKPTIYSSICEAVRACKDKRRRLIVTVPHSSDVSAAKASLQEAAIDYQLANCVREALETNDSSVSLLVQCQATTRREIVKESHVGSTVYMIDSSWRGLHDGIALFGDYIPRQHGTGKCFADTKKLSLCLTAWACHPTQQAAATMNSWTRLIDLTEFEEMLSARVVTSD